ncbi:MAG TPA: metallopeptidase TldD-related protein [Acidimicrobiales bacterium]|nr:metallopeptidase TldD-related protein [Acidimicrobiales bacterium]
MTAVPAGSLDPAQEVVERALVAATAGPCAVLVEERSETDVRFANNTTTTNGQRRDRRVTVVSFRVGSSGTSVGVASRSGAGDVADLVAAAEADARGAEAAEDAAPLISAIEDPSFADAPVLSGFESVAPVVSGLGEVFAQARAERRVLSGFATHENATTYLGTSAGTRLRHVQPTASLQLVARAADGSASAWAGTGGESLPPDAIVALNGRVTRRLAWSGRRVDLPAGRYDAVLPPDAVADLMIVLAEAASGKDAEDGRSVFSRAGGGTRIGDVLSASPLSLTSDPRAPGLTCQPFLATGASSADVSVFDEGAPIGPTAWIDGGRLARLRYHRAGAERSGAEFTPPVDNLTLALPGADSSLEDVIARTDRALLLTCLWYIREVDLATLLVTGLTRDGVFLVENGEVVGAVNNFRFNESPVDMLSRVVDAGRSERALSREWGEWMSRTSMPALRITEFNMSSVSPAS